MIRNFRPLGYVIWKKKMSAEYHYLQPCRLVEYVYHRLTDAGEIFTKGKSKDDNGRGSTPGSGFIESGLWIDEKDQQRTAQGRVMHKRHAVRQTHCTFLDRFALIGIIDIYVHLPFVTVTP